MPQWINIYSPNFAIEITVSVNLFHPQNAPRVPRKKKTSSQHENPTDLVRWDPEDLWWPLTWPGDLDHDPWWGQRAGHGAGSLKCLLTKLLNKPLEDSIHCCFIVLRAGLLWSQQDFEWRWSVPLFKCLTVLEFSFILFDLCLLITFFNFIMNYVPIVTFWIFTYHKIWILSIMFCFIWSYWIIYFLACLEVSWRVVS